MKLRSTLLAATVLVAPIAAKAQSVNGVYIGAGVGVNFMQQEHVDSARLGTGGTSGLAGANVRLDTGYLGVASVGYGFGNGLRVEGQGEYQSNKFDRAKASPQYSAGGNELKYTGFVNVLYDVDLTAFGGPALPVVPYVGLGAGYSWDQDQNARFYRSNVPPSAARSAYRTDQGAGSFAYQFILGAALPIYAVPGLSLTAEYRFMGLAEDRAYHYQNFATPTAARPQGTATGARLDFDNDYNHSFLVGFRYAFNAAPPPVVAPGIPPTPPGVARTYLVFFDWDRADLTDRARQIIAQAAAATQQVQTTRIEVTGNTDTTGTARYNLGLSQRRAQNVAAELVRLGVPRAAITTRGVGFEHLLVPTGPGVREPQNRRVEIVLR